MCASAAGGTVRLLAVPYQQPDDEFDDALAGGAVLSPTGALVRVPSRHLFAICNVVTSTVLYSYASSFFLYSESKYQYCPSTSSDYEYI